MLAEAELDRLVGVVLGGAYELVGRIGEGGMGAVYEAHHLRLHKRVAVKVMSRVMARHPDALARFHREARIASRLGHPNLVNVLDFGTSEDGEPYLVMEHLEGEDLERRVRRVGSVPLSSAVKIARQVASALAVVHAKGIVHRDLKPANIFLVQVPGEPDLVKILDFGVSKIKAVSAKLTDASTVLGTPEYMSPEQASGTGEDIDHRADQWALACIVWEMLSGQTPFTADFADAIFYRLTHLAPPPLCKRAPGLPAGVEPVLLRALSKSAAERYPSVKEFARTLEIAALGNGSDFTPMPFSPAQIAAPRDADVLAEVEPSKATALAASAWGGSDLSVRHISARRCGSRSAGKLVAVVAVLGVVLVGLLLQVGQGGTSSSKASHQTSLASLPVAPLGPVAQVLAPGKEPTPKSTAAKPSSSTSTSNVKAIAMPSTSDPLSGRGASPGTGSAKKANPFVSTVAPHARRSSPRVGAPARLQVANPEGHRTIFEDL